MVTTTTRAASFEVQQGELIIRVPLAENPPPSSSGKTLVVASSRGFIDTGQTDAQGRPIKGSFNFCVPR